MLKIFTYKCEKCGHIFDEFRETTDGSDIAVDVCPKCEGKAVKQFTPTAMGGPRLKGKFNSNYPG